MLSLGEKSSDILMEATTEAPKQTFPACLSLPPQRCQEQV